MQCLSALMHIIYIIFSLSPSSFVALMFLKRVNTLTFDKEIYPSASI